MLFSEQPQTNNFYKPLCFYSKQKELLLETIAFSQQAKQIFRARAAFTTTPNKGLLETICVFTTNTNNHFSKPLRFHNKPKNTFRNRDVSTTTSNKERLETIVFSQQAQTITLKPWRFHDKQKKEC